MAKLTDSQIRDGLDCILDEAFDGSLSDETVRKIICGHVDRALEARRDATIRRFGPFDAPMSREKMAALFSDEPVKRAPRFRVVQ